MKKIIKLLIVFICLILIGLISIYLYVRKNKSSFQIPVLMYHDVILDEYYEDKEDTISLSTFEKHLQYFKDNNYKTLTLDEFYDWLNKGKKIPKKSVVLTFDDGFYSFHYLVTPLLEKYDMYATCFVIGEATNDKTNEFDPTTYGTVGKDIINNHSKNVSYESHSYGLHKEENGIKKVEALSKEELNSDILKMKEIGNFRYMSYPFNTDTKEMIEALKSNNYKLAFRGESEMVSRKAKDYQIPRIGIHEDFNSFESIFTTDKNKNRYGYGLLRKVMIKLERIINRRIFK